MFNRSLSFENKRRNIRAYKYYTYRFSLFSSSLCPRSIRFYIFNEIVKENTNRKVGAGSSYTINYQNIKICAFFFIFTTLK